MNKEDFIVLVFFFLLGMSMGCGCGVHLSRHVQQKLAIDAGVGRWTIDATTGGTKFVYGVEK